MAEVNPPYVLQGETEPGPDHPAILFRRVLGGFFGEGIAEYNGVDDCEVIPAFDPSMRVRVRRGGVYVQGDSVTAQGLYFCYNDANVALDIPASDNSNPRKDIVVARVRDGFLGVSGDDWLLEYIAGTPAENPSEPALPDTAYKLATIDVAANATEITASEITDRRERAGIVSLEDSSVIAPKIADGAVGFNKLASDLFPFVKANGTSDRADDFVYLSTTEWTTIATATVTGAGRYIVFSNMHGVAYSARATVLTRLILNGVELDRTAQNLRSTEVAVMTIFHGGDLSAGDNVFEMQGQFEVTHDPDPSSEPYSKSHAPSCGIMVVKLP